MLERPLIQFNDDSESLDPLFSDRFENDGFSITNEYGSIRRCFVYNKYIDGEIGENGVLSCYREWRDDSEYFVLRGIAENIQMKLDSLDNIVESRYLYKFIKASKRGNDVYKYLVSKKLKPLLDVDNKVFFSENGSKKTRLLFVTLTYDTNRCSSADAWRNIGKEYHLFCSRLSKEYGDFEVFRTWESTDNFYPHGHMLILFKEKVFPVFVKVNKKGKKKFRVPDVDNDKISSFWHSFIDVQGVGCTRNAVRELTKYVTKDLCSVKGDKTNAMIWLFRKQSYAVSKGFVRALTGCDMDVCEPSSTEFMKDVMCNCNQDIKKWEFIGILRGEILGFSSTMWTVDLKKPPPKVVDMLNYEYLRWRGNRR